MCGILGFTHCYRRLPTGVLTRGLSALSHRGPDQKGRFTSAHVSLGAARLRVIDLEGGDQPLHSVDGDITIVFDGESYNHCEIRDELEATGATFKTRCDALGSGNYQITLANIFLNWKFRDTIATSRFVRCEIRDGVACHVVTGFNQRAKTFLKLTPLFGAEARSEY